MFNGLIFKNNSYIAEVLPTYTIFNNIYILIFSRTLFFILTLTIYINYIVIFMYNIICTIFKIKFILNIIYSIY